MPGLSSSQAAVPGQSGPGESSSFFSFLPSWPLRKRGLRRYWGVDKPARFCYKVVVLAQSHMPTVEVVDLLRQYTADVGHRPLLTADEEHALAVRSSAGDLDAREELLTRNLPLVINIALYFQTKTGFNLLDLVQEGNIGLMTAIKKFKPDMQTERGYIRLSTYATWWIRQAMQRHIIFNGYAMKIPINLGTSLASMLKAEEQQMQQLERFPTTQELAEVMGWAPDTVAKVRGASQTALSIEYSAFWNDEGDQFTIADTLQDEAAEDGYASIIDNTSTVVACLDCLTEQERYVVEHHVIREDMILAEMGQVYGLSRERIRQIRDRALKKMKRRLASVL